jgi:uncharacterized protein (TIGR02246 family)
MKKVLFAVVAMLVSAPSFAAEKAAATKPVTAPAAAKGDDAIKAVMVSLDAAITKHDAKALSELFVEDGTFVSPMGDAKLVKGRADIMKAHEGWFAANPAVSTKHTVENIRWIGKDAAMVDCSAEMTGMKMDMPAGAPMPIFHAVALLQMKNGKWLIADARPYSVMPMAPAAPAKM